MRVLLLSLLLQATTQAALLKHEVTSAKRVHYSYRKVCQVMGHRHLLIVEPKNTYQLDCMGSIVDVFDFCKKQFPGDPELTRGFINSKMQEVTCERGTSVVVGIGCDKRDKSYCIRPKEGCQRLGKSLRTL